jgi:UDP-2,3-diacylglucosamine pyrophosphatase LpxH
LQKVKTLWLSDLHLGTKECQSEELLKFLKSFRMEGKKYCLETIFLNGDIIDLTNFDAHIFFKYHIKIIKKLIDFSLKGVKIIYILGNHEYPIIDYFSSDETSLNNNIIIKKEHVYTAKDNKKYLIVHGDQFDGIVRLHSFIYAFGDFLYKIINKINFIINKSLYFFGIKPWSFSHWVKSKTKAAVKYIADFEKIISEYSKKYNVDGVICGHIHVPEDRIINGIRYLNSGTFVEIKSCIIELENGTIELLILK